MRPLCDVDKIDQSTIGNISLKYNSIAHKNLIESDSTLLVIKLHLEKAYSPRDIYWSFSKVQIILSVYTIPLE